MTQNATANQNTSQHVGIKVTTFTNHQSNTPDNVGDWTWGELCESLLADGHVRTNDKEEDGVGLFGFYTLQPGTTRANKNVEQVYGWALDLDKATDEQIAETLQRLTSAGLAHLVYSTHSHTATKWKLRVLGPLSRPVAAKDWPATWRAIIDTYSARTSDEQCKDVVRMYYWPSCKPGAEPILSLYPGEALDPSTLKLAPKPAGKVSAKADPECDLNAPALLDSGVKLERCPKGTSPFQHAEALCKAMPPAVSGSGGHVALLRLARALRWGLELDEAQTVNLISELYNPRCEPAWSDTEIAHKAEHAGAEDGAPYARGALLPPAADCYDHLPLLVQREGRYWLRSHNSSDYAIRVKEIDLVRKCKDFYGEAEIASWNKSPNPAIGKATIQTHSNVADRIVTSYAVPRTSFDPESNTLTEGLRMDPTLEPTRDRSVEAWLTALGGDDHDALQMWIAGCAQDLLVAPAPALGLVGPKSCGKSLIAAGLARQWGDPCAPVVARALVAQFNSDLERCPIVLADEKLPKELTGEDFRELVAARSHSIEPKGKERQTLHGAIRFVVAANNLDRVLGLAGEKNEADVAAIAERWRLIEVTEERAARCVEALKALRLADGSNVDLRKIACHFLWIQRTVTPHRGRFVGAPPDTKILRLLRANEAKRLPELFDLIADYLGSSGEPDHSYDMRAPDSVKPRAGIPQPEAHAWWPLIVDSKRLFAAYAVLGAMLGATSQQVGAALRPFEVGERQAVKIGERVRRMYPIDALRLSETFGLDLDDVRKTLDEGTMARRDARQSAKGSAREPENQRIS